MEGDPPMKAARIAVKPSIAVYGCGAVGLTFAGLLAKAGLQPILAARGQKLIRLANKGFLLHFAGQVVEAVGSKIQPRAIGEPPEARPDVLLLCLKGHQLAPALSELTHWIGGHTVVVSVLNGIPYWYCSGTSAGPLEGRMLRSVPKELVHTLLPLGRAHLGCVIYLTANEREAAMPDGPLEVSCTMIKRVVLGETGVGLHGPAAASMVSDLLLGAGVPGVEVTKTIRHAVWHKLLGNAPFNPISALTLQTLGYMSSAPHMKKVIYQCVEEVVSVAVALGVFKEGEIDIPARIALTSSVSKGFKTSMLQDVEAGREPEIGPLLGTVVDIAEIMNVNIPTISLLYSLMQARADAIASAANNPSASL